MMEDFYIVSGSQDIEQNRSHGDLTTTTTSSTTLPVTSNPGTKPSCSICGKEISNLQNLYKHIRTIHQRRCTKCDTCGSVFRNAESARKHVLKHHRYSNSTGTGFSTVVSVDTNVPAVAASGRRAGKSKNSSNNSASSMGLFSAECNIENTSDNIDFWPKHFIQPSSPITQIIFDDTPEDDSIIKIEPEDYA